MSELKQQESPEESQEGAVGLPVTMKTKLAYGVGGATDITGMPIVQVLANPIFVMLLNVSPAFMSTLFGIQRLWDAFTDPMMGHISDNTRSKWGRLRPYIFVGAILTGLTFASIWFFPRDWEPSQYSLYFAITVFLFMTAHTVFSVPYQALGCELTRDFHERTRVMGTRVQFGFGIFLIAIWIIPGIGKAQEWGWFSDEIEGLRYVIAAFSVLILLAGVICALASRERFYSEVKNEKGKVKIMKALGYTFKNRHFLILMCMSLALNFCQLIVANLQGFMNVYYVAGGDRIQGLTYAGIFGSTIMITSIILVPYITKLSARIGKKNTMIVCVGAQLMGAFLKWFLFTPEYPFLQVIVAMLQGPGSAGLMALMGSMVTDICDSDELETGHRREGMFVAVSAWINKMGASLAVLLGGFILVWIGYDSKLGGDQSEITITLLRASFSFIPTVGALVAIFVAMRYALDEKKVMEIRASIDEMHK